MKPTKNHKNPRESKEFYQNTGKNEKNTTFPWYSLQLDGNRQKNDEETAKEIT